MALDESNAFRCHCEGAKRQKQSINHIDCFGDKSPRNDYKGMDCHDLILSSLAMTGRGGVDCYESLKRFLQ